jgi:uncharacterized damage-inducible protein DinB
MIMNSDSCSAAFNLFVHALHRSKSVRLVFSAADFDASAFQMPAALYLEFTVKHSVHHRGQLSTYLRPMGSKVPAIYGESYDSAEAKKAAQA